MWVILDVGLRKGYTFQQAGIALGVILALGQCVGNTYQQSTFALGVISALGQRKGLLLLVFCMLFSCVPEDQARPIDFVCKDTVRRDRVSLDDMKVAMDICNGSNVLPSPIQLPCIRIQKVLWGRKTLQQKRAEVMWALRELQDGVGRVRRGSTLPCQLSLLSRLAHRLGNDLLIVSQLEIQWDTAIAAQSVWLPECPSQPSYSTSLRELMLHYRALLHGKLERLARDIQQIICPEHSQ